jgi:hypothetical protein
MLKPESAQDTMPLARKFHSTVSSVDPSDSLWVHDTLWTPAPRFLRLHFHVDPISGSIKPRIRSSFSQPLDFDHHDISMHSDPSSLLFAFALSWHITVEPVTTSIK